MSPGFPPKGDDGNNDDATRPDLAVAAVGGRGLNARPKRIALKVGGQSTSTPSTERLKAIPKVRISRFDGSSRVNSRVRSSFGLSNILKPQTNGGGGAKAKKKKRGSYTTGCLIRAKKMSAYVSKKKKKCYGSKAGTHTFRIIFVIILSITDNTYDCTKQKRVLVHKRSEVNSEYMQCYQILFLPIMWPETKWPALVTASVFYTPGDIFRCLRRQTLWSDSSSGRPFPVLNTKKSSKKARVAVA